MTHFIFYCCALEQYLGKIRRHLQWEHILYYVNNMQHNMVAFNPSSNKTMNMELGQVDTLLLLIAGLVSNVLVWLGVIYNGKMCYYVKLISNSSTLLALTLLAINI